MMAERDHQVQLEKVKRYYSTAQKYYERMWYRGNQGLGLHYGLWTKDVTNRIEAIAKENEVLADLAHVKAGDLVLDAGCGVGGSGIWLARHRGAKTVELNISHPQLVKGQQLAGRNSVRDALTFTEADYHRIPFASDSFDVFWSLESIEHADNVDEFIAEAYRILKPGGRTVIAGTFKGHNEPTAEQMAQLDVGMRAAGAFNDFRMAAEVADVMKTNGFSPVANLDITPLVMESARQMKTMCQLGLPGAQLGHRLGVVSQIMVDNTQWGVYQEDLFRSGVTSYSILVAEKPSPDLRYSPFSVYDRDI